MTNQTATPNTALRALAEAQGATLPAFKPYALDCGHSALEGTTWERVCTLADYQQTECDAPWGEDWPEDDIQACEFLSQWDYGDDCPEDPQTWDALAECQVSTRHAPVAIPGSGIYVHTADVCGTLTCYRLAD